MRVLSWKKVLMLAGAVGLGWAVSNSYIGYYGPYSVGPAGSTQFEPSSVSPTVSGSTWVHSWFSYSYNAAYTAAWNGSNWQVSNAVLEPNGQPVGDVFTAYDATHNQYLLVATGMERYASSAYFATSTDGRSWTTLRPIMTSSNGAFDYSSVAVDSTGRIMVGAVLYQDSQNTSQTWGYYVNVSSDGGSTWSGTTQVIAPPGPQVAAGNADTSRWGINGRVAAAGSHFYIFLPALMGGYQFQPLAVYYYMENSGSWTGPNLVRDFSSSPPENNSAVDIYPPLHEYVYYAPLIDASGNSSGTWAVTFQEKTGGAGQYNNVWVCTNTRGCGAVNQFSTPEFMNGVSVDTLGGTWISYVAFPQPYQIPLLHQTIYVPAPGTTCGSGSCGVNGDTGVSPLSWANQNTQDRCNVIGTCLAMGDYARVGSNGGSPSNSSLWLDAPYVKYNSGGVSQLTQLFYYDPQGPPPQNTFTPQQVFYPLGSTEQVVGKPNAPYALGVAPEKRRKMPGFNQ